MPFPRVVFGICPRCRRGGRDEESGAALTGYELKEYNGQYLCVLCIQEIEDKAHTEEEVKKQRREQIFRQQAGVEKA